MTAPVPLKDCLNETLTELEARRREDAARGEKARKATVAQIRRDAEAALRERAVNRG